VLHAIVCIAAEKLYESLSVPGCSAHHRPFDRTPTGQ